MTAHLARTALAAALMALGAGAAGAETAPGAAAPDLVRHEALALAPGGGRVATVDALERDGAAAPPHGRVVVRSATGATLASADPCPRCAYANLSFSPRGELAFTARDDAAGVTTLEVLEEGKARPVAEVKGTLGSVRWSPDGATLAVLATVGAHKAAGAVEAGRPLVGEIGSDPDEQRIGVVSAAGGALKLVSPADTYVYEFSWRPDGAGFVATAAKGDGDDNWWVARLLAYDLDGRERLIAAPSLQMNAPVVSPSGEEVAFIGGLMSDFGSVGGDVYVVPLRGGPPRNVTQGYKGTFTGLAWTKNGLWSEALIGADEAAVRIDPAAGPAAPRPLPLWTSGGLRFSADGAEIAFVGESFEKAPEIFDGPLDQPRPVTSDNAGLPARAKARSVTWRSDGFEVQGWLLEPLRPAPGGHALLTLVHGGPSAAVTPSYLGRGRTFDLLEHGYFIFEPNPRGSYGQGEAFTRANVKDLGGGDLRDILAGVDAVEKIAPVDDRRLGVFGHSYGGFMTMWAVTHTDRFKAAVAGAGVSDWVSYYGENGIDQWMIPFFGASAYDDPAVYDKLSPIRAIRSAKTPTFIYVGERDVECPAPQSIEFWHGLRETGVPTSLVIYPGEGHRIRQPAYIEDIDQRTLTWFDRYLGRKDTASAAP